MPATPLVRSSGRTSTRIWLMSWAAVAACSSRSIHAACAECRQHVHAYLANELGGSRRMLVEDHLSRCSGCRARIAEMKGETTVVAMPGRASPRRGAGGGGGAAG